MTVLTFATEKSSRVMGMSYDTEKQELKVTFKRGGVYLYYEVSEEIFNALKTAPSLGKAFESLVKRAGHKFDRL